MTTDFDETQDYWARTRDPLACLVFLLPLLIGYELGVLWYGGPDLELIRNGADSWMRGWLKLAGLQQSLLLPLLVVVALLGWQIVGKYSWRVAPDTLIGMGAESLLFAFALIVLGQLQDLAFQHLERESLLSIGLSWSDQQTRYLLVRAIAFVGAGVYEEVLFRLCLLPVLYGFFRMTTLSSTWSASLAVLCSSLMFSLAHYVGPGADTFALFSFSFRAIAGMFFAALFFVRGFGITVGCHAAYDLLVGIVLVGHLQDGATG